MKAENRKGGIFLNCMSVREAAEKWNVSVRQVQILLKSGRISGAEKYGRSWAIPAEVKKPADMRCKNEKNPARAFYTLPRKCPLLTMTALCRIPGTADETAKSLSYDKGAQLLFTAQLAYLRGDITAASELIENAEIPKDRPDLFIGAEFIKSLCALYKGNVAGWKDAKVSLLKMECLDEEEESQRNFWLGNIDLELYDVGSLPEWFCGGDFERLPPDCYPMARYVYMKYHMLRELNTWAAVIARPFAAQSRADGAFVSEIYCRLMLAVGYHEQGFLQNAAEQLDRAIELALPDRIYAPFAEYRDNLGTLLDDRLNEADREAAKAVRKLNTKLTEGWTVINREVRGVINTIGLTPQEHQAAKLAAKGLSNAQIAQRMKVSVNTVRRHISEAIGKTGAENRKDLAGFLAMEKNSKA